MGRRGFLVLLLALLALPLPASAAIDWAGPIKWQTWEAGTKEAAAKKKPMLLLVFAEWCPHCRSLAPAFQDKEVVQLAKNLVMIRQNADDKPAWLQERFGRFGSYVPRIFFLKPDGTVAEEIVSGHPRFPYFFQASKIQQLRDAMKKAGDLKGAGGGKGKGRSS